MRTDKKGTTAYLVLCARDSRLGVQPSHDHKGRVMVSCDWTTHCDPGLPLVDDVVKRVKSNVFLGSFRYVYRKTGSSHDP